MLENIILYLRILFHRRINWLKFLCPPQYCENCKLKRSIENWKPSEEQMEALKKTIRLANFGLEEDRRKALESLYEQLKKLM